MPNLNFKSRHRVYIEKNKIVALCIMNVWEIWHYIIYYLYCDVNQCIMSVRKFFLRNGGKKEIWLFKVWIYKTTSPPHYSWARHWPIQETSLFLWQLSFTRVGQSNSKPLLPNGSTSLKISTYLTYRLKKHLFFHLFFCYFHLFFCYLVITLIWN